MNFEKEAEELFGKMRESTKEENSRIDEYLKSISVPTEYNLFDLMNKYAEKKENH